MTDATEELWQGYDEQGVQTSPITKDEARVGHLHGASHVWIWRRKDHTVEILLQRRAASKSTWPNHLDISAAGHIDAGESPLVAAIREMKEEIGIKVEPKRLSLINVYKNIHIKAASEAEIGGTRIQENEYQFLYLLELKDQDHDIVLSDGEVGATYWFTLDEFRGIVRGESDDVIVPHGNGYFTVLFEAIEYQTRV